MGKSFTFHITFLVWSYSNRWCYCDPTLQMFTASMLLLLIEW